MASGWTRSSNGGEEIAISACEQCGRNRVPEVRPAMELATWLAEPTEELKLNLHPRAPYSINTLPVPHHGIRLLIGPGGWPLQRRDRPGPRAGICRHAARPRVLRTETAGLTAITALQCRFGDLA